MATHSSVLAWRIPGMGEPAGLPSMGSHRVGHDWSDLAAAAAGVYVIKWSWPRSLFGSISLYRRDSNVEVRWCEWSLLALSCCSYFVTCHYSELQSSMTDGPCLLNAGSPRCSKHGRPCALRVVRKSGENKGRHFYACPLAREAQCGFFEVRVWFIKLNDCVTEHLGH